MAEQATRTNKTSKIKALLFFLALAGIDAGMLLFAGSSKVGFFTEIGLKKGLFLLGANVVIVVLIVFQNKIREKVCNTRWIKVCNIAVLFVAPVIILLLVQMIINAGVYEMQTEYFSKNIIFYYILYIIFLMIFRKVSVSASLYTIFLTVLALVDYFVTVFRGNAFFIMDIFNVGTAADVAENYSLAIPIKSGICLLTILIFLLYQMIFQSLEIGKRNLKGYLLRLGILGLTVFGTWTNWNQLAGERVDQWDTAEEYKKHGYLYKLACEMQYLQIEKPEEYSVERVNEIAAAVEEQDQLLADSEASQIVPKNVIVIMNESLTDFEEFENFSASEEILPNIHSLQKNTKKGYLYVPVFGGGTSDTEYEVLTGNSKQFLPNGGIAYQLYCGENEYGLANTMEQEGYASTAMHPGKATAWNRSGVYSWMNFEQFINLKNWGRRPKYYRYYASDSSAYRKIRDLYRSKETENQFIFCVTIQNHDGYSNSSGTENFTPDVTLSYENDYPDAETYLSLAKESDAAFIQLLSFFKYVDEPTMIVMFGDHWPSLDWGFFSELVGQDFGTLDLFQVQETYKTPYIIWTNYPSESTQENMSTNYLGSYILEQAGLEMTVYNKFLLQLKEKLPIIGIGAVCDSEGNWYSMDSLPEEYAELIEEYKVLQYNNVVDRNHRVDSIFELES